MDKRVWGKSRSSAEKFQHTAGGKTSNTGCIEKDRRTSTFIHVTPPPRWLRKVPRETFLACDFSHRKKWNRVSAWLPQLCGRNPIRKTDVCHTMGGWGQPAPSQGIKRVQTPPGSLFMSRCGFPQLAHVLHTPHPLKPHTWLAPCIPRRAQRASLCIWLLRRHRKPAWTSRIPY